MQKIMIINGPNLNMLGKRNPDIYGYDTIFDIENKCRDAAENLGFAIDFRQSNCEGEIIDWIHEASTFNALIINAAAYTHTSVAIRDALEILTIPTIEVHLSNTKARETFRHKSYISSIVTGTISGFGSHSYVVAIKSLQDLI